MADDREWVIAAARRYERPLLAYVRRLLGDDMLSPIKRVLADTGSFSHLLMQLVKKNGLQAIPLRQYRIQISRNPEIQHEQRLHSRRQQRRQHPFAEERNAAAAGADNSVDMG